EGQTLAVAGLIQTSLAAESHRISFLGNLPIIGPLTGSSGIAATEQEVVVLITPELVHPMDHKEVPPLPGADLYEPSDVEFYVLGRLESRREYDYRSPVMNDYQRQVNYARCEQIYISGPLGYQPTGLPPTGNGNGNGNGNGGLPGGPHGGLPPKLDNGLPPVGPG